MPWVMARAHGQVQAALRDGILTHPKYLPCAVCGARQGELVGTSKVLIVYHHHDYAAPLWVTPLCRKCHSGVHYGHIPEPATGERCSFADEAFESMRRAGAERAARPIHRRNPSAA